MSNPQYDLLPHKHVRFSDSIVGLAGMVYASGVLDRPQTLDELWIRIQRHSKQVNWPGVLTFQRLFLAVNVLYAMRAIGVENNEWLVPEAHD